MKSRIIATVVFSIFALLSVAMCIFVACYPMGIRSLDNSIKVSQKIQVQNIDGEPIISGKVKNTTNNSITLASSQCLAITLYNQRSGWNYLHISSQDAITIGAKKELDLSTVDLEIAEEDYEYLKATYTWGYSYVVDSVTIYPQGESADTVLIYERRVVDEGHMYLILFVILGAVSIIIAILIITPYLLSKRRYAIALKRLQLARPTLSQFEGSIFLRGAFCQKKSTIIKPSLFSKIKGNLKAFTMGVIINTRYTSAQVMDFIITERGFYVAPANSPTIDVKDMEFFDKEELGSTLISAYKYNVALNPLSNNSYFVFDLSQSLMPTYAIIQLLSKMFEESDEVQNVEFDENTAQKNI